MTTDPARHFSVVSTSEKYASPWLRVFEYEIQRDGVGGTYDVVERQHSVAIAAISSDDRLVLVRQFRFPIGELSWEIPMGGVDAHEAPIHAAKRELYEETGITLGQLAHVGRFHPIPGLTPQTVDVFTGRIPDASMSTLGVGRGSVDEIVELRLFSREEIHVMVRDGAIVDGVTLSSFTLLDDS
jgi:8-oxo-dGTP pyrophosphatase MutT (NUDIX family)